MTSPGLTAERRAEIERRRVVIARLAEDGLSLDEIAEETGVSKSTASMDLRLDVAAEKVARRLKSKGLPVRPFAGVDRKRLL